MLVAVEVVDIHQQEHQRVLVVLEVVVMEQPLAVVQRVLQTLVAVVAVVLVLVAQGVLEVQVLLLLHTHPHI
jgi:hypothetical protein